MTKKIIVICGPTASGKTALALQLAKYFNTTILSFDSRQCYKELDIGVAKPSKEELEAVPHFFINSHSITDQVNAVVFEAYALKILESQFAKQPVVIVVGGTGLYLDALCNGVDPIPDIPVKLREELQAAFISGGLPWLKAQIQQHDKNFIEENDLNNSHRMLRALEVVLHTGHSIKFFQSKGKTIRGFDIVKFGIAMDRTALYERINNRVVIMMQNGLLEEVEQLKTVANLNALQTVGYKELFNYLNKETDLNTAIRLIQQHSRNYAKRQITWFKKDPDIFWGSADAIIQQATNLHKG